MCGVVCSGVSANVGPMKGSDEMTAEWAAVYEQHAVRLTRLAVLLVGHSDAHDVVTDAVWRAVTSRGWRQASSHGGYLTASLVNLAHDRRRQTDRRRRRELKAMSRSGSPGRDAGDVDRSVVVREALGSLSPAQLAVVFFTTGRTSRSKPPPPNLASASERPARTWIERSDDYVHCFLTLKRSTGDDDR